MPKCDFNNFSNFIEITLRLSCSPVNLLHIFRTPFTKNIFGRLLVVIVRKSFKNLVLREYYIINLKNICLSQSVKAFTLFA